MHVICSVVSIGLVKPVWLRGRASDLYTEGPRFNPGRRHANPGQFVTSSAAPARPEAMVVAALAKNGVKFINISLSAFVSFNFWNRIKV